jgi:hypothetical protein
MKIVSTAGARWRFIRAIWYSYSKSATARRPRRMTLAPAFLAKSTTRPRKARTSTRGSSSSGRTDERHALLFAEERLLGDVHRDADDKPVHELQRAADEVGVTVGDRVEAPGVQGGLRHQRGER